MKNDNNYTAYMMPSKICFTSRCSINVNDTWYTLEAQEERILPDIIPEDFDIQKERDALWSTVNAECDRQVEDILRS